MELPKRPKGDEYTEAGDYPALRRRIRAAAAGLSTSTVVVYAFDKRTRLLTALTPAVGIRSYEATEDASDRRVSTARAVRQTDGAASSPARTRPT